MSVIESIAADLGIRRYNTETESSFTGRIVLSGLSKWMLTACFTEIGEASVESIKAVAAEKLSLLRDSMSLGSVSLLETGAFEDISDYIYKVLKENGAFYHIAYRVMPRERQLISLGKASIIQGMQPEENCVFSGLAPLAIQGNSAIDIADQFDLPNQQMDDILNMVWKKSVPVESNVHVSEYLKFTNLKQGYYSPKRTDNYPFTMGRTMHPGVGYERYIIHGNETRRIPDDFVQADLHEYCRLGIINSSVQQCVYAKSNSSAVVIKFDYKLPASDLRFMRYIGWPASLAVLDSPFEFTVHPSVWPIILKRLQHLNYKVVQ